LWEILFDSNTIFLCERQIPLLLLLTSSKLGLGLLCGLDFVVFFLILGSLFSLSKDVPKDKISFNIATDKL